MEKKKPPRLTVHVQPGASRNEVNGLKDGILRVRIAAPPVEGKANRKLVEFLSDRLGVSPSRLTIERGATGKDKVVSVEGLTVEELVTRLARIVAENK